MDDSASYISYDSGLSITPTSTKTEMADHRNNRMLRRKNNFVLRAESDANHTSPSSSASSLSMSMSKLDQELNLNYSQFDIHQDHDPSIPNPYAASHSLFGLENLTKKWSRFQMQMQMQLDIDLNDPELIKLAQIPDDPIPSNPLLTTLHKLEGVYHYPFVLQHSARDIASQLTLIEASALACGLSRFNCVVSWLRAEVVLTLDPAVRAQLVAHMLDVAELTWEQGNFSSTIQIVVALGGPDCWVPKESQKRLEFWENHVSAVGRFEYIRKKVRERRAARLGCVPFVGIWMADLEWLHGLSDWVSVSSVLGAEGPRPGWTKYIKLYSSEVESSNNVDSNNITSTSNRRGFGGGGGGGGSTSGTLRRRLSKSESFRDKSRDTTTRTTTTAAPTVLNFQAKYHYIAKIHKQILELVKLNEEYYFGGYKGDFCSFSNSDKDAESGVKTESSTINFDAKLDKLLCEKLVFVTGLKKEEWDKWNKRIWNEG